MLRHFLLAALFVFPVAARAAGAADHYYWRPAAADGAPRPYAVLLPGSSGLKIFNDDEHYFRAAKRLNALGVDALVIDYHKAVKYVPAAKKGEAGQRMLIIVEDALKTMRASGRASARCPAAVIGWSLGGEGAWTAAAEQNFVKAVVVYYPTTRAPRPYRNTAPVLALQGEADDVTPLADLNDFAAARPADAAPLIVQAFAGARHGFDVESIVSARSIRFPPVVGPKATFGHDPAATAAAHQAEAAFLRDNGIAGGACGP